MERTERRGRKCRIKHIKNDKMKRRETGLKNKHIFFSVSIRGGERADCSNPINGREIPSHGGTVLRPDKNLRLVGRATHF